MRAASPLLAQVRRPFFLSLLLLVTSYLLAPVLGGVLLSLSIAGALILSTYACHSRRRIAHAIVPLLALLPLVELFAGSEHGLLLGLERAIGTLLVLTTIFLLLESILRSLHVDPDTIFASICCYFLLGVLWAFAYSALSNLLSTPAFQPVQETGDPIAFGDLLYFSLVTLTTLGYGDMTPLHPLARSFATVEALVGQMFVAILIARLVAIQITNPEPRDTPGGG